MYIEYELPDYWVIDTYEIKCDSTGDYVMSEDLNITF